MKQSQFAAPGGLSSELSEPWIPPVLLSCCFDQLPVDLPVNPSRSDYETSTAHKSIAQNYNAIRKIL